MKTLVGEPSERVFNTFLTQFPNLGGKISENNGPKKLHPSISAARALPSTHQRSFRRSFPEWPSLFRRPRPIGERVNCWPLRTARKYRCAVFPFVFLLFFFPFHFVFRFVVFRLFLVSPSLLFFSIPCFPWWRMMFSWYFVPVLHPLRAACEPASMRIPLACCLLSCVLVYVFLFSCLASLPGCRSKVLRLLDIRSLAGARYCCKILCNLLCNRRIPDCSIICPTLRLLQWQSSLLQQSA